MRILIIGGTGTLGNELTRQLLAENNYMKELRNVANISRLPLDNDLEITIFSRDELKQQEMRKNFKFDPRLRFMLGDIRDQSRVEEAMIRQNVVFHVAALKHIDVIEANPTESIKTNIFGTINIINAAKRVGVDAVIFSSTDKAVDPINVYGMCKGISEKLFEHYNNTPGKTKFKVFRWGNVIGSRGSVIHNFAETLKKERKAYVTDTQMTRFWIRIEDAVRFIIDNYKKDEFLFIPPMKSAPILDVIKIIGDVIGVSGYDIVVMGLRPGEKMHEVLRSQHGDNCLSSNDCLNHSYDSLRSMISEVLCQ